MDEFRSSMHALASEYIGPAASRGTSSRKSGTAATATGHLPSRIRSPAGANDQKAAEEISQSGGRRGGQRGREVRIRRYGVVTQPIEKGDIRKTTNDYGVHR